VAGPPEQRSDACDGEVIHVCDVETNWRELHREPCSVGRLVPPHSECQVSVQEAPFDTQIRIEHALIGVVYGIPTLEKCRTRIEEGSASGDDGGANGRANARHREFSE
jgi:hypothetical protein